MGNEVDYRNDVDEQDKHGGIYHRQTCTDME